MVDAAPASTYVAPKPGDPNWIPTERYTTVASILVDQKGTFRMSVLPDGAFLISGRGLHTIVDAHHSSISAITEIKKLIHLSDTVHGTDLFKDFN